MDGDGITGSHSSVHHLWSASPPLNLDRLVIVFLGLTDLGIRRLEGLLLVAWNAPSWDLAAL